MEKQQRQQTTQPQGAPRMGQACMWQQRTKRYNLLACGWYTGIYQALVVSTRLLVNLKHHCCCRL